MTPLELFAIISPVVVLAAAGSMVALLASAEDRSRRSKGAGLAPSQSESDLAIKAMASGSLVVRGLSAQGEPYEVLVVNTDRARAWDAETVAAQPGR